MSLGGSIFGGVFEPMVFGRFAMILIQVTNPVKAITFQKRSNGEDWLFGLCVLLFFFIPAT